MFNDTRYTPTTTPHDAVLRDPTQTLITYELKDLEKLHYMMLYENGIGNMTEEEKAESRALGFQNGIGSMTEDQVRVKNAKISVTMTGKKRGPLSTEHKAKLGVANKGRNDNAECNAKISAAMTGRKRGPLSAEHKAKLGVANEGRKNSAEHNAKISATMTGRKRGAYNKG